VSHSIKENGLFGTGPLLFLIEKGLFDNLFFLKAIDWDYIRLTAKEWVFAQELDGGVPTPLQNRVFQCPQ
jgi:hypothetical protein